MRHLFARATSFLCGFSLFDWLYFDLRGQFLGHGTLLLKMRYVINSYLIEAFIG